MIEPLDNRPSQEVSEEPTLFGVPQGIKEKVSNALKAHDLKRVRTLVHQLHSADIADLFNRLGKENRSLLAETLKENLLPEVLLEIDPALRSEILEVMSIKQIVCAVEQLESDDAVELLEDLDKELKIEILKHLSASERTLYENVLAFPEDSVGRIMQREMVCVPPFWSLDEVRSFIQKSDELPNYFYDVFVVDARFHPVGIISLNQLVRHPGVTLVESVMDKDIHPFPATADQEEVSLAFRHYALMSTPIVSSSGRILGMITVDDVVEVIEEEAQEDMLHMHKVHGESDFYSPIPTTAYWRIRWLLITLVNTLIASFVISQFEASIQKITALSFLMTINAAMGGNSGMQVVTVVVRALATRNLRAEDTWRAIRKELRVGFMVGGFCAVLLGGIATLWVQDYHLGLVLTTALMANMVWAAFAGTLLPIVIDHFGMDPAISAGPLLTTTTDVLGYSIFLGLATHFLM